MRPNQLQNLPGMALTQWGSLLATELKVSVRRFLDNIKNDQDSRLPNVSGEGDAPGTSPARIDTIFSQRR